MQILIHFHPRTFITLFNYQTTTRRLENQLSINISYHTKIRTYKILIKESPLEV